MIFVDTSYWVALRNRRDRHHAEAAALLRGHADSGWVTSNHVRGETWTYLRRRAGHGAAVQFLEVLEESTRVKVVTLTESQERAALAWLRVHDEREYSFVDAASFVLMNALKIHRALAFGGDFSAAGLVELRA